MPKIESEKIDCLCRPCSRPAPRGKIESVRTHSEVVEQFDSFSLLKLLLLVRKWHCWSQKAFPRQMTPQSRGKTAKTAVFRHRWQAWKVVPSIAAVRQRPRTPRNRRCSFAFFETFLWHFNKKQRAEVIFRLSRPVSCKNQENGSGKRWSLHAPLKYVRIFGISDGAGTYFRGGMMRRSEKFSKEEVCSTLCFLRKRAVVHGSAIMHILPGYRGTYIWGHVFSEYCRRQQISRKNEGYLFSEGYLFTGFYGIINDHQFQSMLHPSNEMPLRFFFFFYTMNYFFNKIEQVGARHAQLTWGNFLTLCGLYILEYV